MGDMPGGMVVGIIAGIIGGIVGACLLVLLFPRKSCPECGVLLTRLRNCWDTAGVMRRCRACGCGVDARGRKREREERKGRKGT